MDAMLGAHATMSTYLRPLGASLTAVPINGSSHAR
jgi:hypothetical protein